MQAHLAVTSARTPSEVRMKITAFESLARKAQADKQAAARALRSRSTSLELDRAMS